MCILQITPVRLLPLDTCLLPLTGDFPQTLHLPRTGHRGPWTSTRHQPTIGDHGTTTRHLPLTGGHWTPASALIGDHGTSSRHLPLTGNHWTVPPPATCPDSDGGPWNVHGQTHATDRGSQDLHQTPDRGPVTTGNLSLTGAQSTSIRHLPLTGDK